MSLHTCQNGYHRWINEQLGLARVWRKGNPSTLLVGMQTGAATVENSMEFPQKIKNGTAFWPSNSTSGNISEEIWNTNLKDYMHPYVHSSISENSQDLEIISILPVLSYQSGLDNSELYLQPLLLKGAKKCVQATTKHVHVILTPVGARVLGCGIWGLPPSSREETAFGTVMLLGSGSRLCENHVRHLFMMQLSGAPTADTQSWTLWGTGQGSTSDKHLKT